MIYHHDACRAWHTWEADGKKLGKEPDCMGDMTNLFRCQSIDQASSRLLRFLKDDPREDQNVRLDYIAKREQISHQFFLLSLFPSYQLEN